MSRSCGRHCWRQGETVKVVKNCTLINPVVSYPNFAIMVKKVEHSNITMMHTISCQYHWVNNYPTL